MPLIPFEESMIPAITTLWNESVAIDLPYKPFTPESFTEKFLNNPHFDERFFFVFVEEKNEETAGNTILGFAQGICKKTFLPGETNENTPGYITMTAVHPAYRRKGMGSVLLNELERVFKQAGKTKAEIIFFNPINLEWVIPNTDGHEHPNTPGLLIGSPGHAFFLKHGYITTAEQNAYHRSLEDLPPSTGIPKLEAITQKLSEKGIFIEAYRPDRHTGLDSLFDDLNNEHWRSEIKGHLKNHPEWPLLVVSDQNKIVGFAGPVYPQPNGRGFFSGIGVHSAYGGMGIGTLLFYRLCETEKERGAAYMSLFTGVNNPARRLYEAAGFTIAAKWTDMRKFI